MSAAPETEALPFDQAAAIFGVNCRVERIEHLLHAILDALELNLSNRADTFVTIALETAWAARDDLEKIEQTLRAEG